MSLRTGEQPQETKNAQARNDAQPRSSDKPASQQAKAQSFQQALQRLAQPKPAMAAKLLKTPQKIIKPERSGIDQQLPELREGQEKPLAPFRGDCELSQSPTLGSPAIMERQLEKDPNVIAQASIANGRADDINLLIKKLTLNFSAKNNEAKFSIANGVFEGTQFALITHDHDLILNVSEASSSAKALLVEHQDDLKNLLLDQEINLRDVRFIS